MRAATTGKTMRERMMKERISNIMTRGGVARPFMSRFSFQF
jgi:hypothetical protein